MKLETPSKNKADNGQVLPKENQKITYFCKLCREYEIKNRLTHLVQKHNAKSESVTRRKFQSVLEELFVEGRY